MLTAVFAHAKGVQGWHDLWWRWSSDPLVWSGLAAAALVYRAGAQRTRRTPDVARRRCFWVGLAAVAVALLSPLDPLAADLASAHMVQHVLLVLVAAPLLAFSAPATTMLLGAPRSVRRVVVRARARLRHAIDRVGVLQSPAAAWLLHAATLWFWHASVPYDAALEHPAIHALEHATFLGTAMLFWSSLVRVRASKPLSNSMSYGYGAMLVFTMAMQSVFLSALLTFASTPWYAGYRDTTQRWGLDPLLDQQLAGTIMWVPAGLIYVGAGVLLVAAWVRSNAPGPDGHAIDDWGAGQHAIASSSARAVRRDEDRRPGDVHADHEVALHGDPG